MKNVILAWNWIFVFSQFPLHWIEFKLDFPFDKEKKANMLFVNWCLVTRDKLEILEYIISLILGILMKMYLLTIFWIYFQYVLSYIFSLQSCFFQALFFILLKCNLQGATFFFFFYKVSYNYGWMFSLVFQEGSFYFLESLLKSCGL